MKFMCLLSNFSRSVAKGNLLPHMVTNSFAMVFPSFAVYRARVSVYGEQGSPRMSSPELVKSSQDFLTDCGVRLVGTEISPPGRRFF